MLCRGQAKFTTPVIDRIRKSSLSPHAHEYTSFAIMKISDGAPTFLVFPL